MTTKKTKVPVTERALLQRINRALRKEGEVLKKLRGVSHPTAVRRDWPTLGDYYTVDIERNFVAQTHVDLDALGRKLKVLADWEALAK